MRLIRLFENGYLSNITLLILINGSSKSDSYTLATRQRSTAFTNTRAILVNCPDILIQCARVQNFLISIFVVYLAPNNILAYCATLQPR